MSDRDGESAGDGKEDVLASIRRVVARESDAEAARRDGVLPLTGGMRAEAAAGGGPGERGAPGAPTPEAEPRDDRPFLLTPSMRVDAEAAAPAPETTASESPAPERPAEPAPAPAAGAAPEPPAAPRNAAPEPVAGGAGALEGVAGAPLRSAGAAEGRAIRGAMSGREAPGGRGPTLSHEALTEIVRRIIREELSGELGRRVSANIKLLVEREVTKAIEALTAEEEDEARRAAAAAPDRDAEDGRGDGA